MLYRDILILLFSPDSVLSLEAEEEAGGEVLDVVDTVDMLRVIATPALLSQITWDRIP